MRSRRTLIVLVLALALVTPGAWAGEIQPQAASASAGILQQVWSWLTGLWIATEVENPSTDAGCKMDPLGCPRPTSDAGWGIDPLG